MKHFGLLCILLILVHFSTQIPQYENCTEDIKKTSVQCDCCKVTCFSEGEVRLQGCPVSQCFPGTQIGYDEDMTQEFPGCCGYPTCKNE